MNTSSLRFLFTIAAAMMPAAALAGSVSVTDFRLIDGGLYFPISGPLSGEPRVWDLGDVSITSPSASIVGGTFFPRLDGPDPSGSMRLAYLGNNSPAIFNLSQPVAALGVTFQFTSTRNDAILRVYDAPNASGNLIGSVGAYAIPPPWTLENDPHDFVAIWANDVTIRSFSIDGPSPNQGASITGYAVSFVTIPEPAAGFLASILLVCAAGIVAFGRRR